MTRGALKVLECAVKEIGKTVRAALDDNARTARLASLMTVTGVICWLILA